MVKSASDLGFDELATIAKAASEDVRARAALTGKRLPIWHNGQVVFIDPQTGVAHNTQQDRLYGQQNIFSDELVKFIEALTRMREEQTGSESHLENSIGSADADTMSAPSKPLTRTAND